MLQLSSPVYNATRKTLSFSATRVGPPLLAELLFIQVHGNITIGSVQVFVDSLILDIIFGSFSFGAQVLNQYGVTALGGGVGWQIASLALVTIIEAFTPKSSGPAPATQAELQAVAASLQQVLTLVTDVSIEVEVGQLIFPFL